MLTSLPIGAALGTTAILASGNGATALTVVAMSFALSGLLVNVGLHLHERSDPKDFPRGSAGTGRQPAERPGWGTPDSTGHYVDFGSAVLGLTMFPAGYLCHALARRDGSPRF